MASWLLGFNLAFAQANKAPATKAKANKASLQLLTVQQYSKLSRKKQKHYIKMLRAAFYDFEKQMNKKQKFTLNEERAPSQSPFYDIILGIQASFADNAGKCLIGGNVQEKVSTLCPTTKNLCDGKTNTFQCSAIFGNACLDPKGSIKTISQRCFENAGDLNANLNDYQTIVDEARNTYQDLCQGSPPVAHAVPCDYLRLRLNSLTITIPSPTGEVPIPESNTESFILKETNECGDQLLGKNNCTSAKGKCVQNEKNNPILICAKEVGENCKEDPKKDCKEEGESFPRIYENLTNFLSNYEVDKAIAFPDDWNPQGQVIGVTKTCLDLQADYERDGCKAKVRAECADDKLICYLEEINCREICTEEGFRWDTDTNRCVYSPSRTSVDSPAGSAP